MSTTICFDVVKLFSIVAIVVEKILNILSDLLERLIRNLLTALPIRRLRGRTFTSFSLRIINELRVYGIFSI